MNLNLSDYWGKLAQKESFSEDEISALLKMAAHYRDSTAYLASCQAATAESLPARTSMSARTRHVGICESAGKLLRGDPSPMPRRDSSMVERARERCEKVVKAHGQEQ